MIRIITARYLTRLKGANERHQTAHANRVREIEGLRRQVDAAIEPQGQLTVENSILRGQLAAKRPEASDRAALLIRVRNAEDRARALDERLLVLQRQNEQSYELAYDAHRAVAS